MIKPKKNIRELARIDNEILDRSKFIRLDKNERTVTFKNQHISEMILNLEKKDFSMYPDQSEIYSILSKFIKIDKSNLLLTSGSDVAIKYIFETFIKEGDRVASLNPTYEMFNVYAKMFGAEAIKINFNSNLKIDISKILNTIQKSSLLYIANPNQPTGTIIPIIDLKLILEVAKKNSVIVIIDEAYLPFCEQKSSNYLIKRFNNLIVIQTFSKSFGLASARLGYVVSNYKNINWINRVKPIYDINLFALEIGKYLLNNYNIILDYIEDIKISKRKILQLLYDNNLKSINSKTNFIHIKLPSKKNPKNIYGSMKKYGVLIRIPGGGLPAALNHCVRLTLGPYQQMEPIIKQLIKLIKE